MVRETLMSVLATGQFPDGTIVGESGKGLVSADGWLATGSAGASIPIS